MNRWLKLSVVLWLGCWPFHSVRAWNAEGHMIVAQIAYNHLNPIAKARCDALIAISLTNSSAATSNFVTASVWADDNKTALGTGIWHYIDLPFSLDGTSTSGVGTASFDVVRAINLCITNLQSATASPSNQAVSLRYLLHFVGDIQQPLHCSTAVSASRPGGDGGGNSFTLDTTWFNLHSLWDGGGGFLFDSVSRPLSVAGQNALNAKVAQIESVYPYNYTTNLGTIPNPLTWAQEGFNLAKTNCYVGITNSTTPTTGYLNNAASTTSQRMAQGGHRLADLLNTLFQPLNLTVLTPTNGTFRFSWNTVSNTSYKVQWKLQLSDAAWSDLTNLTAKGGSISFTDQVTSVQRFYRIAQ
jgi:hypothetical protein